MSTRSYIAIENADKTIDAIYCHNDGYIENNGRLLNEYYQDPERVQELIALGDLSSLGQQVEPDKYVQKYGFFYDSPEFVKLSMEEQMRIQEGRTSCVAYHRDRGEDFRQLHFKNSRSFSINCNDGMIDYFYLFKRDAKTGQWGWYAKSIFTGEYSYNLQKEVDTGLDMRRWHSLDRIIAKLDGQVA